MSNRHAKRFGRVVDAIFGRRGTLAIEIRQAVRSRHGVPAALEAYVHKVAEEPSGVTAEDLDRLRCAGYSDDQIYELTVSAAMSAALERLHIGLQVLSREE